MEKQICIYLVDDHKIVRDGIKSLLFAHKLIKVTGEAENGAGLLALLDNKVPDIVVLDITLPDISGVELTKILSEKYPCTRVIILTAEINEDVIVETVKRGACGFLNKDVSSNEFIEAIKLVSQGESYFGQRISGIIYKSYINKIQNPGSQNSITDSLTDREKQIIMLLSEGLSFKEIGHRLCISPRTVENHKTNILEKLSLKNTIELVKFAIKNEIISL